jgi:hypothetical protein
MNAHMQGLLEEIVRNAEAIIPCGICGNYYVIADDADAELIAYAMATNACKRGEFRSATLEEVRHCMKSVLDNANHRCPSCG